MRLLAQLARVLRDESRRWQLTLGAQGTSQRAIDDVCFTQSEGPSVGLTPYCATFRISVWEPEWKAARELTVVITESVT
jgi:hypothetical protein